jgi:Flp pilus assembly protein TadG
MAADLYYNDYAFRDTSSKSLKNERERIIVKAQKIKSKNNVKSFAAIASILIMSVILIYLYGQLMEVNYSLNYGKNRLNTLSVKTEELRAANSSKLSSDQVKEYARANLNMREPSKNQIKYMNLKQADSTLMIASTNKKSNAFEFLLSIFK